MGGYANIVKKVTAAEPASGDYLVRFIDFDGTILKEQWVNAGQAATAPTPPTHQYLTFDEWNNTFTNIQHDLDVGATYYTTDGKTYLFMRFTNTTGLQPSILLNKADTQQMNIDWGDGTGASLSGSGNITITKAAPYAAIGDYTITIECAGNYSFYTYIFNNNAAYNSCLLKCFLGATILSLGTNSMCGLFSLTSIVIPKTITTIGGYSFYLCYSLTSVVIPLSITILNERVFRECVSLRIIVISKNVTSIEPYAFYCCHSLSSIVIPDNVITIKSYAFYYCHSLKSIFIPDSVVSIEFDAYNSCYSLQSILIPEGITSFNLRILIYCYSLTNIIVSYRVINVINGAFFNCFSIKRYLFLNCIPPTLANINAFTGINLACKIYVPDASVSAYQAATNWVTYASYIYPISELPEYDGTIFWQTNGADPIREWRGTPGAPAPLPIEPIKTGFTFAGWYKDEALTAEWDQNTDVCPATNITLYAKWV